MNYRYFELKHFEDDCLLEDNHLHTRHHENLKSY
jgi:hypothetical protein